MTTPRPASLRTVLLGAGRRGLSTHVETIAASPRLELARVVDLTPELPRVRGEVDHLRTVHRDLTGPGTRLRIHADDAPAWHDGPVPDIAVVATPHHSHLPLAVGLLNRGVPVLLEKPPAIGADELKKLIYECEQTRVRVATLMPARYLGRFQPLRDALESGQPGLDIEVCIDVPFYPGFGRWRTLREQSGGGVLFDLGYHVLDLVVAHLGQPSKVEACLTTIPELAREGVDTAADAWLSFEPSGTSVHLVLRASVNDSRAFRVAVSGTEMRIPTERRAGLHPSVIATLTQVHHLLDHGFLSEPEDAGAGLADLRHHLGVMELVHRLYAGARWMEAEVGVIRR